MVWLKIQINLLIKNKKHTHFELAAILLLEWENKSYLQTNYLSLPCQQQPLSNYQH